MSKITLKINPEVKLVSDVRTLIDEAKKKLAVVANTGITMLYWQIGERINREILGNKRAEYGKKIVSTVSTQLQQEYGGQEFSIRNLRRMMQFAMKCNRARSLRWGSSCVRKEIKNK